MSLIIDGKERSRLMINGTQFDKSYVGKITHVDKRIYDIYGRIICGPLSKIETRSNQFWFSYRSTNEMCMIVGQEGIVDNYIVTASQIPKNGGVPDSPLNHLYQWLKVTTEKVVVA